MFTISSIGRPALKEACLVLWRKKYIPIMPPKAPPNKASKKSVFSGTRHAPRFARALSMPIMAKRRKDMLPMMVKRVLIVISIAVLQVSGRKP